MIKNINFKVNVQENARDLVTSNKKDIKESVVYNIDVPADSANYVAVNKIGGMTRKCTNLIPFPYFDTTKTVNGITFTNNGDGSITVNGTATAQAEFILFLETSAFVGKELHLSGNKSEGILAFINYDGANAYDMGNGVTLTPTGNIAVWYFVQEGVTVNNRTIYPMLNEGSTALPYEPYFEGLRSAKVTEVKSVGVNLWGWGDVISTQYAYSMDRLLGIIEPNKQYTLTWKYASNGTKDTQNQIIVYTENGSVCIVNGHPFTISEAQLSTVQGVYMYFGSDMTIGSMTGIMINKGSTALPYTPYVEHTLPIPVEVRGSKNLAPSFVSDTSNMYVQKTPLFEVQSNTDYYISAKYNSILGTRGANFFVVKTDGSPLYTQVFTNDIAVCINSGDNTKLYLQVNNGDEAIVSDESLNWLNTNTMLNKGATAKPYEPYSIAGLDGYGLGVNESVYNYIDYEKKQFVKRVGEAVFDGTERWIYSADEPNPCFRTVLQTAQNGTPALCSHFEHANYPYVLPAGTTGVFGWDSSFVNVYFASELTDVDTWKAYLATQYANGNPVTVVYELAEPEVTDISDLITADNLLGVEGGGTLTFENEYGYAVPSEVVFYNEKAEIVAADKIVGDLVGTASRAISDEDGNDIVNTYVKKTGVVEKAIMAERITTIDLSKYNGTDNIPVEFARAIGDDKCYALIVVQSGSLYPSCVYYLSNDDDITQIAGRVNNSLITKKEDYMATEKTIGYYCGKLGHNFPQITILAFAGNINFFVGEKRTNEDWVESSKYLYFGKPYINDENANTLDIFSRGANGLTFGQAKTLKTFAETGVAEKAVEADRIKTIDLSKYNDTTSPIVFARALNGAVSTSYCIVLVYGSSYKTPSIYALKDAGDIVQLAGETGVDWFECVGQIIDDGELKDYTVYKCKKFRNQFPVITVLGYYGEWDFYDNNFDGRTFGSSTVTLKNVYLGRTYLSESNVDSIINVGVELEGLNSNQFENLKMFAKNVSTKTISYHEMSGTFYGLPTVYGVYIGSLNKPTPLGIPVSISFVYCFTGGNNGCYSSPFYINGTPVVISSDGYVYNAETLEYYLDVDFSDYTITITRIL